MTNAERQIATELARIKLELRQIERNGVTRNPQVLTAIGEACDKLQIAIASLSTQVQE